MKPQNWLRLQQTDSDRILHDLSTRQHVSPHKTLQEVLEAAGQKLAFCPNAARAALGWLGLDSSRRIGRLTRTELIQLSRSIHRFWRQSVAAESNESQPA